MGSLFRKIRGLAGVGLTWGAVWGAIGAGVGFAVGRIMPDAWMWTNPVIEWALGMGLYGVVSGIGFGALLALREGSKTLFDLSLKRVALWGLLGSAAVPLIFASLGAFSTGTTVMDVLGAMGVTALLGAASAPTAVAIARQAALSSGERRDLLSS